jgi:hypothetical protein
MKVAEMIAGTWQTSQRYGSQNKTLFISALPYLPIFHPSPGMSFMKGLHYFVHSWAVGTHSVVC